MTDTPTGFVHRLVDSPVGTLLLVGGAGLVRIAFEAEGHDEVLGRYAAVRPAGRSLDLTARQLDEFFAGRRRRFDLRLDLTAVSPFRRRVLEHLSTSVPFGSTTTYRAVAGALGRPHAVRAVGSGCATNPLPVVVPCHRVLRSDGGLGGFLGGLPAKEWLLAHEATSMAA